MKKRVIIRSMARRIVAVSIIGSMALTGIEMMDSSAFNGVLSGDGLLSGDGTLSGNGTISGNATSEKIDDKEKNKVCRGKDDFRKVGKVSIRDLIFETSDDAVEDAKKTCNRYSGAKFVSSKGNYYSLNYSTNTIKSVNYSQSDLNAFYYSYKKKKVNGTCAEVAMTILSEYYNYKQYCEILEKTKKNKRSISYWQIYFCDYIDLATKEKYFPAREEKGGTKLGYYHVFKLFYDMFGKKVEGKASYATKSEMKELIKHILKYNNRPLIGDFFASEEDDAEGHTMVIVGLYTITITYKLNGKTYSYNVDYYVVNNGGNNCEEGNKRIQYIRTTYLYSTKYITCN